MTVIGLVAGPLPWSLYPKGPIGPLAEEPLEQLATQTAPIVVVPIALGHRTQPALVEPGVPALAFRTVRACVPATARTAHRAPGSHHLITIISHRPYADYDRSRTRRRR